MPRSAQPSSLHKRPSSPSPPTSTRQSKRLKSSPLPPKATPKKSQFFTDRGPPSEPESEISQEDNGYADEDVSGSEVSSPAVSESEPEESEEYLSSSDEDTKKKQRLKRKPVNGARGAAKRKKNGTANGNGLVAAATAQAIQSQKGKELWRPGVKSDLAPGEAVFIKLPKARGDGGVKYQEGVIHPNTLLFLRDLRENNDREWLKGMYKPD
ncbi:MAG: hypothetical protein Q9201_006882 [Fulgogasparrea decipioides]